MMTPAQQIRCIFGAACRWGEHQWNHRVSGGAGAGSQRDGLCASARHELR